jgi:hypothetical protein
MSIPTLYSVVRSNNVVELGWWLVTSTQATYMYYRVDMVEGVQGSGHRDHLESLKQMATLTTCGHSGNSRGNEPTYYVPAEDTPKLTA